jgi:hypothetical protein
LGSWSCGNSFGSYYYAGNVLAVAQIADGGSGFLAAEALQDRDAVVVIELGGPDAELLNLSVAVGIPHGDPDGPPFEPAGMQRWKFRENGYFQNLDFTQNGQTSLQLSKAADQTIRITIRTRVAARIREWPRGRAPRRALGPLPWSEGFTSRAPLA